MSFRLATPDDSGASLASWFRTSKDASTAAPGDRSRDEGASGGGGRWGRAGAPDASDASAAEAAAARRREARASPATPLAALPPNATLLYAARWLAERAGASAAADADADADADAGTGVNRDRSSLPSSRFRSSLPADHDRWLSRVAMHYDVRVEGVPPEFASSASELAELAASDVAAAKEERGEEGAKRSPRGSGAGGPVEKADEAGGSGNASNAAWTPEAVRARLSCARQSCAFGAKLTKAALLTRIKRLPKQFPAPALASLGLDGSPKDAARRVTAEALADAYESLHADAEKARRAREAEAASKAARRAERRRKLEAEAVPPPPPARAAGASSAAWRLFRELVACQDGLVVGVEAWNGRPRAEEGGATKNAGGGGGGGSPGGGPARDESDPLEARMDARLARWRGVPSEEEEDANADAGAGSARGSSGGGGGSSLPLASDDVPGDPAAAAASAIALLASLRAAIDSDASDAARGSDAYARGSGAAAPSVNLSSSSPLGSASWCNARLARKLSEQLKDAVAVASGALPSWIGGLLASTRFLFPLATRLRHFRATAFGTSRGVTWAQERAGAGGGLGEAAGGGGGDDDDDPGEDGGPGASSARAESAPRRRRASSPRDAPSRRVTVRRSHVLEDAEVLMRHHARHKSVLEVLVRGEEGVGGAVTTEFYNKTAHALRDRARNERAKLWLTDEHGADVAAGGAHLMCARGLFPRPIPPGTRRSEDAEARFAFVGRLVGKALLDGHMLPLPLHGAFLRAAVHGDELGAADVEEVFCERTQGGATMAWIARLAKKARAKRMLGEEDASEGGRDANDDEDPPHPPPRSTKRSRDASSSPVGRAIGRRRLRRSSSFSDECEPRRGSAERKPFFSQKRRSLPPRGFDAGDFLDDAFFSDDDECDCPPKPKPKPKPKATGARRRRVGGGGCRGDGGGSEDAAETAAPRACRTTAPSRATRSSTPAATSLLRTSSIGATWRRTTAARAPSRFATASPRRFGISRGSLGCFLSPRSRVSPRRRSRA